MRCSVLSNLVPGPETIALAFGRKWRSPAEIRGATSRRPATAVLIISKEISTPFSCLHLSRAGDKVEQEVPPRRPENRLPGGFLPPTIFCSSLKSCLARFAPYYIRREDDWSEEHRSRSISRRNPRAFSRNVQHCPTEILPRASWT